MSDFMDRWIGRLKNHPAPTDTYTQWRHEYDAELAAARADTPALPKVTVAPFTAKPRCEKCGNSGIRTEYHDGVHTDCPHLYMSDPRPLFETTIWGTPSPRVVVARERQREAAVEHLDRRCCNCEYAWTTATAPAPRAHKSGGRLDVGSPSQITNAV